MSIAQVVLECTPEIIPRPVSACPPALTTYANVWPKVTKISTPGNCNADNRMESYFTLDPALYLMEMHEDCNNLGTTTIYINAQDGFRLELQGDTCPVCGGCWPTCETINSGNGLQYKRCEASGSPTCIVEPNCLCSTEITVH